MTITANSHKVETSLVNKAIDRAKNNGEKIAICTTTIEGKPMQFLATLAEYETSNNKANIVLVAVYDADGNRVD